MEILSHLYTTMLIRFRYFSIVIYILGFFGCQREQPSVIYNQCGIDGHIQAVGFSNHMNGFKITIQKENDTQIEHVAVSDECGDFCFRNLDEGIYRFNVIKEGFRQEYAILDHNTIIGVATPIIKLEKNEIRDLSISMYSYEKMVDDLELTDLNGQPLSSIIIPSNTTTISFRLFNGTQSTQNWKIQSEYCCGTIRLEPVNVFLGFSIESGRLSPGDNVVIIGYINPEIFSSDFELGYLNKIFLYAGNIQKEIMVSIE